MTCPMVIFWTYRVKTSCRYLRWPFSFYVSTGLLDTRQLRRWPRCRWTARTRGGRVTCLSSQGSPDSSRGSLAFPEQHASARGSAALRENVTQGKDYSRNLSYRSREACPGKRGACLPAGSGWVSCGVSGGWGELCREGRCSRAGEFQDKSEDGARNTESVWGTPQ